MAEEIWADVPGYEGLYRVSSLGHVESRWSSKPRLLKPTLNGGGYPRVQLFKTSGCGRTIQVHRLMALAFLGHPGRLVVRHLNDQKTDNRLENLAYGTNRENSLDAVRNQRFPNQRKTHCKHGHEFTEANTYMEAGKWRTCRTCNRESAARYNLRRRQKAEALR